MDLPKFKYHPNVYELDLFVKELGRCSVCNEVRDLKYVGSFYSVDDPDYLCPWCIVAGSAAAKYDGSFNDYCGIEGVSPNPDDPEPMIDANLLDEICSRTPSYFSWQQEKWLTHCNEPCAFIDYTDTKMIAPFYNEIKQDLDDSGRGYSSEMLQYISQDGSVVGYLFQCVKCGQHKLHIDCD
ncbi:CbrC family protein [Wohlfahrtiimonas larvae]|uniref:PF03691 family colicin E2 tolerance protein CbrC n=1 Tax=Wohlfahrtiimonas larvae TaxID=1157986 RepID=A0ABP9MXU8_9GAMM|nr:CbrC family protein [Wohlfahrtiimonas larvae]